MWLRKAFLKEVQLTRSDWRESVSGPCISTPAVRSELMYMRGGSTTLGEGEGLWEEHEEGQAQLEPGHISLAAHRKDFRCYSESERGEAGEHDLMCVSHVFWPVVCSE